MATFSVLVIFCIATYIDTTLSIDGKLQPVSTEDLQDHLRDHFNKERSFETESNKNAARAFIQSFFNNLAQDYSTEVKTQSLDPFNATTPLQCENNLCQGENYYWILPGSRYGTADDKLSVLGAHYDTVYTTPGVNDNGAGMAAMLETARVLATSGINCPRLNSVLFVAFDWEEYNTLYGSNQFVSNELLPLLSSFNITKSQFAGAVILDTILDWDDSNNSQSLPLGFDQAFPDLYQDLFNRNFRGDFISVINRPEDNDIGKVIEDTWASLAEPTTYLTEKIMLPIGGNPFDWTREQLEAFGNFLRSDHTNFWANGLKAVFLTDTANFRGYMKQCYHNKCDNVDMITPERLEFLAKVTETLVRYHLKVSTEQEASACGGSPQDNWASTASKCSFVPIYSIIPLLIAAYRYYTTRDYWWFFKN